MKMVQVVADGQVWTDQDGVREFDEPSAITLEASLQAIGYQTELVYLDADETDEWDDEFDDDEDWDDPSLYDTSDPYGTESDLYDIYRN